MTLVTVAMGVGSLIGIGVTVGALLALHIAHTGLSPVREPVSAYGISKYRQLYRVQTVATTSSAILLAGALLMSELRSVLPAVITLIILAVARAVISWFPMDAEGAPVTSTGRTHNVLAYVAFAAASVGGFMTGIAFAATPDLQAAADASTVLGWTMTGASVVTIMATQLITVRPILGLAERVIYLGMLSWLTVSSLTLIRG